MREWLLLGGSDKNSLKLTGGDNYTIVWILKTTELYTLNQWSVEYVNFINKAVIIWKEDKIEKFQVKKIKNLQIHIKENTRDVL